MKTIFRATAALALLAASLPALAASATATRAWQFKPESNAGLDRAKPDRQHPRRARHDARHPRHGEHDDRGGVAGRGRSPHRASSSSAARTSARVRASTCACRASTSRRSTRRRARPAGSRRATSSYLGERIRLVGNQGEAPARAHRPRDPRARRREARRRATSSATSSPQNYSGKLRLDGGSGLLSSTGGEGELELDNGSGAGGRERPSRARQRRHRQRLGEDHRLRMRDLGRHRLRLGGRAEGQGQLHCRHRLGRRPASRASPARSPPTRARARCARAASATSAASTSTRVPAASSIEGDLSALSKLDIDTGSGSVSLRSSAQPSLELRIDTGSGGVDVDAPGATIRETDDVDHRAHEGRRPAAASSTPAPAASPQLPVGSRGRSP